MIMIVHNNLSRKSLTYDKEVKLLSFIYAEIVCVWNEPATIWIYIQKFSNFIFNIFCNLIYNSKFNINVIY